MNNRLYSFATKLNHTQKRAVLLMVDIALIPVVLALTLLLQGIPLGDLGGEMARLVALLAAMMGAGAMVSVALGLPRIKLNAYEHRAMLLTCLFAVTVGLVAALGQPILTNVVLSIGLLATFTMGLIIVAVFTRVVMHQMLISVLHSGQPRQKVLIYGAGQTGVQLATALVQDNAVEPVAFIDDNPVLQNITVMGLPVYAPTRVEEVIKGKEVERVVLAMPSISAPKQARIARQLTELGCEVRSLPSFAALVGEGPLLERTQPVNPGIYLNRSGLEKDMDGLCAIYAGTTVMITGAGGSIGSELCRQVLACRPAHLVLFESNELGLYQIERELLELIDPAHTKITSLLGSVVNETSVRRAISTHDVTIILHAAAYKHVPMVERNQLAGLRNNVLGTRILAEAAQEAGVSHFVLISTDKAVRPTNVMGASKRLAELVIQDLAARADTTHFSMVRFGNVLGSSGSVIPLFEEQIARGGPVTLTHREVSRYFMTVGEAARLVLLAGNYTKGGDVFMLDMGSPVLILKLAKQMIEQAGYSLRDTNNPDGDIEIVITGLRPGEKIREELQVGSDTRATAHPKIRRVLDPALSQIEVATALKGLHSAIEDNNPAAARAILRRWVDGYVPATTTPRLPASTHDSTDIA